MNLSELASAAATADFSREYHSQIVWIHKRLMKTKMRLADMAASQVHLQTQVMEEIQQSHVLLESTRTMRQRIERSVEMMTAWLEYR